MPNEQPEEPTENNEPRNIRVAFDFHPNSLEKLNELQERLEVVSKAEVLRRALALLEAATAVDERKVLFEDPDGTVEEVMKYVRDE